MAIYSVSDLKSKYLNLTGTAEDTFLTEASLLANGYLKAICRQPIEQETVTLYLPNPVGSHILLPYTVPVTISSAHERETPVDSFTALATLPTVYEAANSQKALYLANGFSGEYHKIVLSVGYASGYPDVIRMVFAEMVKEIRSYSGFASEGDRFGVKSQAQNIGGFSSTTTYQSLEKRWRSLLSPYTFWS